MRVSQRLRKATAVAHSEAELHLNAAAILNGSLSRQGFERMVVLHHGAWSAAEEVFREAPLASAADHRFFAVMVEALQKDLHHLGLSSPVTPRLELDTADEATRFGIRYVLHGSTLGGTLINRHLRACPALADVPSFHFHSACEALPGREWPAFLRRMDASLTAEDEVLRAVAAADATFRLYTPD